jgi:hypothetical protein
MGAMEGDEAYNPYAPPKAGAAIDPSLLSTSSDFASERRSVLLCFVLSVVTFGVYAPIWLLRRRRFLNGLDSSVKLWERLPWVILAMLVVTLFIDPVLSAAGERLPGTSALIEFVAGALVLIAEFRVANILRSEFRRSGRGIQVSSLAVFFLGVPYLQYKVNQGADTPARLSRRRPGNA